MTALATVSASAERSAAQWPVHGCHPKSEPTYFAVLFTDCWDGEMPTKWAEALRMLAALAEENPGYLGYEVEEMGDGREYAVTRWSSPGHIRQWKKAGEIVIGDKGLLSRIYGREGCLWPWLECIREN